MPSLKATHPISGYSVIGSVWIADEWERDCYMGMHSFLARLKNLLFNAFDICRPFPSHPSPALESFADHPETCLLPLKFFNKVLFEFANLPIVRDVFTNSRLSTRWCGTWLSQHSTAWLTTCMNAVNAGSQRISFSPFVRYQNVLTGSNATQKENKVSLFSDAQDLLLDKNQFSPKETANQWVHLLICPMWSYRRIYTFVSKKKLLVQKNHILQLLWDSVYFSDCNS